MIARSIRTLFLVLVAAASTGCLTFAGGALEEIEPLEAGRAGVLEYTVGDFEFTLDGGKMVTSNRMGRDLQEQLLMRWEESGYISSFSYVPDGQFSGNADYELTLNGSQYGESSIFLQLLSGLTLMVLPYSVDTNYDINYVLADRAGNRHSAAVADSYTTWVEVLLILAAPVSLSGANSTWDKMAHHLYGQLHSKGAFAEPEPPPLGGSTARSFRPARPAVAASPH